jgi:hypothetical protein
MKHIFHGCIYIYNFPNWKFQFKYLLIYDFMYEQYPCPAAMIALVTHSLLPSLSMLCSDLWERERVGIKWGCCGGGRGS